MWRKNAKRKFGNQKTEVAGHWFDSKLEAALFHVLALREKAGEIRDLRHHPGTVFLSEARVQYRPDFRWVNCATEETEYGESKGYPTQSWAIKKRLWKYYGPGTLYIYGGTAAYLKLVETIKPRGEAA